ncbi:MAG: isoprenylcysteine carboxylmethyltransferase family protein [Rhodobiaceae bacterium]|nr:isoprenylcysteine carboxylmethyltransferase family protein [Rhodobiaceae bacterium]
MQRDRSKWTEIVVKRMPPPGWFAICLVGVVLFWKLVPQGNVLPDWLRGLGYFEIFLGLALMLDVVIRFFRARTTVHPFHKASVLVTDGMLRFSRNPIYLGFSLILFGVSLILGTLPGMVMIPTFMWAVTRYVILDEEAMLEAEFGQAYRDYKARVRRWL